MTKVEDAWRMYHATLNGLGTWHDEYWRRAESDARADLMAVIEAEARKPYQELVDAARMMAEAERPEAVENVDPGWAEGFDDVQARLRQALEGLPSEPEERP